MVNNLMPYGMYGVLMFYSRQSAAIGVQHIQNIYLLHLKKLA